MPESSFLIISFACLYVLFRLLQSPDFRRRIASLAGAYRHCGVAWVCAFSLFVASVCRVHASRPRYASTRQFGWRNFRISLRWRLAVCHYVSFTVLSSVQPLRPSSEIPGAECADIGGCYRFFSPSAQCWASLANARQNPILAKRLTVFFFASLLLMLLKRFGNPLINWVGGLPIANLVLFLKYQEPLMAFCIAILAGIGFSFALRRREGIRLLQAAAVIVVCTVARHGSLVLAAVQ